MSGYGSASGRGEHSVPGLGPTLDRVTTVPSAPPPRDSGDSYAGSPKTSAWHQPQIPWVRNWIVQNKRFLFALCFATLVISFNGRWRIGLDSSIYRGLAASLANGHRYQFGEFGTHQVYPGLPILLAGVQKLTGDSVFRPVFSLLLIAGMAIATLVVTYRLMRLHFEEWVAIAVTVALGLNARFVQHANELLTDIPFLLGLVTSLYGWDLLRRAQVNGTRGARWRAIALFTGGLLLAAVMRPTFWILGLAMLLVCLGGLITGPRKFYATCLTILLAVWLVVTSFDPRTKGFHPFGGGYESEALEVVQAADEDGRTQPLLKNMRQEIPKLLEEHLPDAMFGQSLPWRSGTYVSLLLIAASVLVFRRQPMWALLLVLTVVVTSALSTAPRYYIMILPLLILTSLLLTARLTERVPGGYADLILLAVLGTIVGMNIAKIVPLVREQHSVSLADNSSNFYKEYRHGKFLPVMTLADVVKEKVKPDEQIITPSATIVQYLSGRRVYMERELLPSRLSPRLYPEHLKSLHIDYAIFPSRAYRDKEPEIARLIDRHILEPGRRLATLEGMILSRVIVNLPPPGTTDWRHGAFPENSMAATRPSNRRNRSSAPTTSTSPRHEHRAPTTRHVRRSTASTQPTTDAAAERRRRRRHPAATTAPTTPPATQPAQP